MLRRAGLCVAVVEAAPVKVPWRGVLYTTVSRTEGCTVRAMHDDSFLAHCLVLMCCFVLCCFLHSVLFAFCLVLKYCFVLVSPENSFKVTGSRGETQRDVRRNKTRRYAHAVCDNLLCTCTCMVSYVLNSGCTRCVRPRSVSGTGYCIRGGSARNVEFQGPAGAR